MTELAHILLITAVLYVMKALPFVWRIVPRGPLVDQAFDLLPVALLMAMLMPQVLRPVILDFGDPGRLLALLAVAVTFAICMRTNRAGLGIGAGLAILALAEFV